MIAKTDYYRGDQRTGITAPDLSKDVDYADHIVKARGKRTQYTSVSKEPEKIRDFGEQVYRVKQPELQADHHKLIEHDELLSHLREKAKAESTAEKLKAVQAMRYAKMRLEGLVHWAFDISGVDKKDLINWAEGKVRPFFVKHKSP